MGTVHRTPASPNWLCYYNDRNGKRRTKSTLTRNKKEADRICAKIQSIEDQARSGNINRGEGQARHRKVVGEIMVECGAPIQRKSVREHFTSWLKAFEAEQGRNTYTRYKASPTILGFLGSEGGRKSCVTAGLGR